MCFSYRAEKQNKTKNSWVMRDEREAGVWSQLATT